MPWSALLGSDVAPAMGTPTFPDTDGGMFGGKRQDLRLRRPVANTGVAGEVDARSVVASRRTRVGGTGTDLDIAERYSGVEGGEG
jgi:hypothetical protein